MVRLSASQVTGVLADPMGDDEAKVVAVLFTDRFGAVDTRAFTDRKAAQTAFTYASPVYAHVLYETVVGLEDKEGSERIGDETWLAVSAYGTERGITGIKARARRLLFAVSSGNDLGGDISREHLGPGSLSGAFRAVTLPWRLSGSVAKALTRRTVSGPKRPTWNASFEAAISVLRSAAQNVPRSVSVMRFFTDVSIPGALLPAGAIRAVEMLRRRENGKLESLDIEWIWPKALTPDVAPATFSYAREVSAGFCDEALAPILRERLRDVPVILYLHGGAFALCGRGTHRELTFRLALDCNAVVCVPEYRRPPDATLSETLADVKSAYVRLLSYGVEPSRVVFAGDSAGGGLCLSLLRALRGELLPAAAVLISPWVDLDEHDAAEAPWGSRSANSKWDFLPRDLIDLFSAETTSFDDADGPYFYRRHASDPELKRLPPLLVHVGQCEVLHDQIVKISRDLAEDGVPVTLVVWRDMVHVSTCFAAFHDSPKQQIRMSASFARAATGLQTVHPTFLQVEARAALHVPLGNKNTTLLSLSTAALYARLSDSSSEAAAEAASSKAWIATDRCRGYTRDNDGDKIVSFDWGANGSNVTILLGPLDESHLSVDLQLRCATSFGTTSVLLDTTAPLPVNHDDAPQFTTLTVDQASLVVALSLVTDSKFVIPSRLTVDPPLLRDPNTTDPAHIAPAIDLPLRVTLPAPRRPLDDERST